MSEALSLLHRIRYTPMSDVLRGRFTGRLGWMWRIDESHLPNALKDLTRRVVRRTRLWNGEQRAVADELIAHFSDGLAAGATAEQLFDRFGNIAHAARLIRRAKVRNRPIVWHALRAIGLMIGVLMVVYAALTLRYFSGRPTPNTNFVAIFDQSVRQTPVDQRAWPIYRDALGRLFPRGKQDIDQVRAEINAETYTENWHRGCKWVRAHPDVIAQIQHASTLPSLGMLLDTSDKPELRSIYSDDATGNTTDSSLARIGIPYQDLNLIGSLLYYDAWDRIDRDDPTALESVRSLLRLADQVHQQRFPAIWPSGFGLRMQALSLIDFALSRHSVLWDDATLIALAHDLSGPRVAADVLNERAARASFYDIVQRAYTDDGSGDGRITPAGAQFLNDPATWPGGRIDAGQVLLGGATAMIASRKEVLREYDSIMDQFNAELNMNARDVGPNSSTARFRRMFESTISRWRYLPLELAAYAPSPAQWSAERYLAQRDGIEVAIALELFRRRHHEYPAALAQLVPDLLPEVPADRISGEPLHYRIRNGQPIVYSVGIDRDDDGGRIFRNKSGVSMPWAAIGSEIPIEMFRNTPPHLAPDGDWILFPQPDPRD